MLSNHPGGVSCAPYTLLVNSSDGFADCWEPFFRLLDIYWPDRDCPVLLNTERSRYDRVGVESSQINRDVPRRLSWSECLIGAVAQVRTPLLLYVQEDYFLEQPVDTSRLADAAALMLDRPAIGHIGLSRDNYRGPHEPWTEARDDAFVKVHRRARYRISTQAGLWRPETLLSYLDPSESGWMFEIFGTRRAWRRDDLFLTVNADEHGPIIDYTPTGIMKGRWHHAMPALFARHGITMDFDRRGFYEPLPGPLRRWAVARKLLENPARAWRALVLDPLRRFLPDRLSRS